MQSPYFASMFSGSWRETNEKVINVEITDPNITMNCKNLSSNLIKYPDSNSYMLYKKFKNDTNVI